MQLTTFRASVSSQLRGYLITAHSYLDSRYSISFNRQISIFRNVTYNIAYVIESLCPVVRENSLGWNFSNNQTLTL